MIYDISQPLLESVVFPGNTAPKATPVMRIANGDPCNLTDLTLCVHNGTHTDAPLHFVAGGKGIGNVALHRFIGPAYVCGHEGDVTAQDARSMLREAARCRPGAEKRLLIRGNATVTLEAAEEFARAGIELLGNESQTVGPESAPRPVHRVLLGKEVVLLEGIRLSHVPDGAYLLNCAPLNLSETDGAPCRAVLLDARYLPPEE